MLVVRISDREPVYAIGIVAEMLEIHPRTLRIYEECGLIRPARTRGNIRLYSQADLELIQRVRYLTQVKGVNLAGVRIILQLEEILGPVITGSHEKQEREQGRGSSGANNNSSGGVK
ncbi:MerR family transcriptional regulator [Candidatus Desulforudis audaxviator]|uniref:Putative transcriptional regulator, MerR family n=1 Tax=Desulforudis audaxviator (strain MP104C) TaxID=477974 RepID=B1I1R0_DESAP|nr:putative transcriptional regulator, MerR family [Candidatus Desulforudis audaxviator MP104C]